MAILDDAKLALRISSANTAYDSEVADLIAAAQEDLVESGVAGTVAKAADPVTLIKRAIITYVKANFGWNNPDSDRLKMSYDTQTQKLSLIAEYRGDTDAV